jgi:TM2 domain-containing membrane protein YozV
MLPRALYIHTIGTGWCSRIHYMAWLPGGDKLMNQTVSKLLFKVDNEEFKNKNFM